ncbi:LUD domain-containing protein [Nonomuraea sp. CA-143628]|uniref:LUD domain-containing protein n=1 Tax=Nonomuraea sp. CA-143628 TaxID=3239997 RepID=UPI003D8AA0E6
MTMMTPNAAYAIPADPAAIATAATALQARGYHVRHVPDAAAARLAALELLPEGAEVFSASSVTTEAIGLTQEIDKSGRYTATRPQMMAMDPATQMSEMRRLGAAPQWVVGSVHALTCGGDLVIASASGSQLASMAYGAQNVLLIIGVQKIVPDLETAMRRVHEYSLPLEDARARSAYGMGSTVHKVLTLHGDIEEGRVRVVLVDEPLGY